ncbi:MAG: hypothetical protein ASARMPRED_004959 [Alectoria sarmentosa]|nr:MAG: hypothetical protein ASARMPRED_004959 [Alectoria sarmentosa]
MAPPLVPRGSTYSHYLHHNRNDDFGFPNNERPINLPPVYSAETPLLTPLDLLAPQEPSSPGSPLVEMRKNLSAMQIIISQRLLLAKEYGTAAIEGAFRKAEWERDRARRMEQSRGPGSTGAPKNATPNTPYIDWSPISAGVVPLAYRLPTSTANRPRSRTIIPLMGVTSAAEISRTEHPNRYQPSCVSALQIYSTIQDQLPAPSDQVPLTIRYCVLNLMNGISDLHGANISVPSSVSLYNLKKVTWTVIQDGDKPGAPQDFGPKGWIQNLIVHWDIDKQVYHHFPPTTKLKGEVLESMLVCLRDVMGDDWIEVAFETP